MTWNVVHLADVAPTPWKNGGGTTRELVAWPDEKQWVWRMSVAEVTQRGPFSRFDGAQRWFSVLSGAGVALSSGGQRNMLTLDSAPFCFDGGEHTVCDLLDGPTQDFNLMTRSAGNVVDKSVAAGQTHARATVARVRGDSEMNFRESSNAIITIAIYSISTWANAIFNDEIDRIVPGSLVWRTVSAHDHLRVEAQDALLMQIDVVAIPLRHASEAPKSPPATRKDTSS